MYKEVPLNTMYHWTFDDVKLFGQPSDETLMGMVKDIFDHPQPWDTKVCTIGQVHTIHVL